MVRTMTTNWKTTIAGVVSWLIIVLPQIQTLLDSDPATNPDWNLIVASTMILFGFSQASDAKKEPR